jgi:hypothetical protein
MWREICLTARPAGKVEPQPEELDPLRIKDLRHLSAVAWAMAAVPIERTAHYLGHSTIRAHQSSGSGRRPTSPQFRSSTASKRPPQSTA